MKKSQLRKIIRESIKGLLTEQVIPNHHAAIEIEVCGCIGSALCSPGQPFSIGSVVSWGGGFLCNGTTCTTNDTIPGQNEFVSYGFSGGNINNILNFKILNLNQPQNINPPNYDIQTAACSGGTPDTYDCINGACTFNLSGTGTFTGGSSINNYNDCLVNCTTVTPSWDCDPITGCLDPGTGLGQYTTLSTCQLNCVTPSWDCNNGVCSDPGTGNGQYSTITACQQNCSVSGCTDPQAINLDPLAGTDDGSCYGCMDSVATNYCPLCNADCQNTVGGTNMGCCTGIPVPGCTDPLAQGTIITGCTGTCNEYDPLATIDDGSCCTVGCTDSLATNYDPNACIDDNSCTYPLPPDTYDCGVNYNCVINTTGTGTYSGGTTTQNLSACQNNCQAPTYNIGCADPTATPCSQFPPAMQNSIQCYESNHDGCGNPPDPNDNSCCTYNILIDPDLTHTSNDTCSPPSGGCPPLTIWNGQPGVCQCLSVSWTPGTTTDVFRDNSILTTQTTTPTCSNTDFANYSGPSAQDVINAYQIGLQNNQAYGILDGNSIFCTESCGFSNTHWACDCCGPLHCDDISIDNWVPYGCWKCDDDTNCSDNGNFISTGQNFYNTEPACVAQASINCPPPPPTPRNLPGSKARLQELANIKKL
jgi:hypothetical protein